MKRNWFSPIYRAVVASLTASVLFIQVSGCIEKSEAPDTEPSKEPAAVAKCMVSTAVTADGPAVSMSLKQGADGSVQGSYMIHSDHDIPGEVNFAPDLFSWDTLPTGETTIGYAGDPNLRFIVEDAQVLITGGLQISVKTLDGAHHSTISLPDFDTSQIPNLAASGGVTPMPQAAPLIGPVAAFCAANPLVCIIIGAAVLIGIGYLYLDCSNKNSQAWNACLSAGNCPSGGSCGIGGGKWWIGINQVMPTCTSCNNTPPPVTPAQVCPMPQQNAPVPPGGPANPPVDKPGQDNGF